MEKNRYLNIKGANLEKEQLNKYITQIAEEHIISKHSDKDTYPIGKLKENCEVLFIPSELKKNYLLGDTLVLEKNCPLFIIDFQKNVRKDENAVIIKVMNYEFKKKIKKITLVSDLEQETVTLYKTTVIERIEE